MEKLQWLNPDKVEYDGASIRLIIKDEAALLEWLIKRQKEIVEDLELVQEIDQ